MESNDLYCCSATSSLTCYHYKCEMLPMTYDTTGTNRTKCLGAELDYGESRPCSIGELCAKGTIGKT